MISLGKKRYQARAKQFYKMGRDGLLEQNRATGEEKRVSQRTADVSFGRERPADWETGRRSEPRTNAKKRRKQPQPIQQTAEEVAWASTSEPTSIYAPEPVETYDPAQNASSMRMAADAPLLAAIPVTEPAPPPLPGKRRRNKKLSRKAKKRQTAKFSTKSVSSIDVAQKTENDSFRRARDTPLRKQIEEKLHTVEGGGRLHFEASENENPLISDVEYTKKRTKQKQMRHFTQDAAKPVDAATENVSTVMENAEKSHSGVEWDATEHGFSESPYPSKEDEPSSAKKKYKQQQSRKFSNDVACPKTASAVVKTEIPPPENQSEKVAGYTTESQSRSSVTDSETAQYTEQRQAQRLDEPAKTPEQDSQQEAPLTAPIGGRLRFEDEQDQTSAASEPEKAGLSRQQQKYEKAAQRAEKAEKRVEQAREKLPTKRRLVLEKEFDSETSKLRHRLRFEQEIQPEYVKPPLPARVGGMAKSAAVMKLHSKIRKSERENVSVEAAHKSELLAEQSAGKFLRWNKTQRRSQPYRALRRAERQAAKEKTNLAWQAALRDHPELQKQHTLVKWVQKQQIKRKYAQAAHESKQAAQFTQNVLTSTGQIVRAVAQQAATQKSMLLVVTLLALIVMFFSAGMTSCTAMLSGIQSSYISTAYLANEEDICDADLYYTEMETDLQLDINKTEENYPGYDEYHYNIGEISHNPYELLGYLSTKFNAFTFDEIRGEIEQLFHEQYTLTREAVTETREDDSGDPYEVTILQTTLTVKPLFDVIGDHLTAGEEADRYGVYMQTLGNRQAFGNPFAVAWLGSVTSGYGYRVHPMTGEKDLHRGIDIAAAQGTAIHAIQDGFVTSAGDAGSYGLCVTIANDQVYESRYAHCSSLAVSSGQEVKRGDVIGAVGSTGDSTGPHLHLEVLLNGEYLNPYFFVDTGDDGTGGDAIPGSPGGPEIPDYSGSPVGDGTFAAMLEEAEKYLGWPYVWGGSSPATSFDCSGFVCWVLNQSGAMSIERTTATGIYNRCTPIPKSEAQPGDLIFFTRTYSSPGPISHIGIYVGDGKFIHCGNPISYASVNNSYWQEHFYAYARIP